MASLGIIVIVLICMGYQYLKGSVFKAFAAVIITACSMAVAFGYFEVLANLLIDKNIDSAKMANFLPWTQPACLVLIFGLTFAILHTIATQLTKKEVDLGTLAERAGRCLFGLLMGLMISGVLLAALAMSPIPNEYPYLRFDPRKPNPDRPSKALPNVDGFVTGWVSAMSSGSFSGSKSFAAVHPSFLDQAYLNRISNAEQVTLLSKKDSIELPRKGGYWDAPAEITDSAGKEIAGKSGHSLKLVRIGLTKNALEGKETSFTPSQIRLICKDKGGDSDALTGTGRNVYPIGYVKAKDQIKLININEKIILTRTDLDVKVKWVDFAFYVPNNSVPAIIEFKQNVAVHVAKAAPEPPATVSFIPMTNCTTGNVMVDPVTSVNVHGVELVSGSKVLDGVELGINDANEWSMAESPQSLVPAVFKDNKLLYARSGLILKTPESKPETTNRRRRILPPVEEDENKRELRQLLNVMKDYTLVSLKCNNPAVDKGKVISFDELPVLVELSGKIHKPVGVVVTGKVGEQNVCELSYCSVGSDVVNNGLVVAEDGTLSHSFFDSVILPGQADSIDQFQVLYLVKPVKDPKTIIVGVKPGQSEEIAGLKKFEGFYFK